MGDSPTGRPDEVASVVGLVPCVRLPGAHAHAFVWSSGIVPRRRCTYLTPCGFKRSLERRPTARRPRGARRARKPRYGVCVSSIQVPGGVVHKLPRDLREVLIANDTALIAWNDITPLARNEFICWVEDAKQKATRERRIRRTKEELEEGKRRPCCWPGCAHRERNGKP